MNWVPTIVGTIERRILINYRVDADVLRRVLPSRFRPQLIGDVGIAGLCMIRLSELRPAGMPRVFGVTTENAAHRIAVEWDGPDGPRRGVYIPRRDTESRLTVLAGGRLFPGEHHRARFSACETDRRFDVAFSSVDDAVAVGIAAELAEDLSPGSAFASLEDASTFFEGAPLGYSATQRSDRLEALELDCANWSVQPLRIEHAESSYFENQSAFPAGTVELRLGSHHA